MEDFEYSVEICDRDWDCFFAECEECNLLPPALAGVDDSGMSDIDDMGSILAARVQKVVPTAGFSEADRPIDGPPDCEGSPVEHYLSKHAVGGMESVLSGSEEDIHLQSVNIFFEKLKNLTEAERPAEPSQARDEKKRGREAIWEKEQCGDGQQASSTSLPKNIPKLNSRPASCETAVGNETAEPVDTISNINTVKKDVPGSNISPEPAASKLALKTNKSTCPETRSFIREEACTETRVNEAARLNQSHASPEVIVCSETATPHTDRAITVEMYAPLDDKREDSSTQTLSKKCSADSSSNQEMVTHVKREEDPDVLQSDATRTNKPASQQSSPSASVKRKRRKKRRLSVEPAESVHGSERQVLVKQSDSEDEQRAWRGGLCLSEDIYLSYLHGPQKYASLPLYSAASNLPVTMSAKESKVNYLPQYLLESVVRKGSSKGSAENNATNDKSVNPPSQTDDRAMSAPNNSGNVATHLQPCSKSHVEESTVSIPDGVTGKSDVATETANCARKDAHPGVSIICCENEQNPESRTAEVKLIGILLSAESNDPAVAVSQCDKLSAAKSVLAVEAGNSGRDNHTLCYREAESQQQLEIDCQDTDRYRSTLEKSHFPLSASSSDARNTKHEQLKTEVGCAKLASGTSNSLAQSPSGSDVNVTAQQTEHPLVPLTLSKFNVLPEKNTTGERSELAASQIMALQSGNPSLSGKIHLTGKSQTNSSTSEDLLTSPSHITPVSSCCNLDTESVTSLSNGNITDASGSSCLSVNQSDLGEKTSLILAKHEEGDGTSESKSQSVSTEPKCDSVVEAEDVITASEAECKPDSKHSVFAISSFWSEMEKLTINDILGLRMIGKAAPPSSLPPLQESEEADMFAMTDSGFFTQPDESKPEQINEDTPSDPISLESSSGSVLAVDSPSSRGVTWESLEADIYPENMMLTSVRDISQPILPEGAQRNLSKNVSVHNLHALKSLGYTRKGQTLQTVDEGELQKVECVTDGHTPKRDKDLASFSDSYRISLTDIFQYLFRGKQSIPNQSIPSESATDDIISYYTDGNSVPETYDHFFSEFDTESFFYPLIAAEHPTKDELVPIFSCSRSASRNLQYPEAYDHFFPSSSSSDESSDEEDGCGPVRVVTKFSHTSSASQISTDIYDNFFTDSDLRQNFFWKPTLSFRNMGLTRSTVQKQTLSSPLPVRQSGRSPGMRVHPIIALGNQDMRFPDPLLGLQPHRYEDLQMAVSNPRLDASLLPLRQSDMCLVCIAFASWVLKTANPQVGDTWKAVLLANVSALSAIRYLRKYVKMEAAASEKKLNYTASSDS
ncbi:nucleolar complex protein 2 homolog isoform X1 [Sebastes umbrosus]|uniref:nucleolar complex protein 2 homolog isoform X1 n=1 Tax=Sebastes umbrosus TaxID=72105 RepID=UPI00189CC79B|nr:nucleolar complex protein 2 homolog isoform X1 [Sebastes umbrosus]XP_037627293.1 nucleolar complex protein 2 homolog isoform X1 [Sebastes umbrosus]